MVDRNILWDCKGNVIRSGQETAYPFEGIWWDGTLQREILGSPGGSGWGSNVMIMKFDGTRLIQQSSESSWAVHAGWAVRPLFVGDIMGDWREEVALMIQNDIPCIACRKTHTIGLTVLREDITSRPTQASTWVAGCLCHNCPRVW